MRFFFPSSCAVSISYSAVWLQQYPWLQKFPHVALYFVTKRNTYGSAIYSPIDHPDTQLESKDSSTMSTKIPNVDIETLNKTKTEYSEVSAKSTDAIVSYEKVSNHG